jgi:hypothetical protein
MVSIKVKLQKRLGQKGKYEYYVVTILVDIIVAVPKFKNVKEVDMDVDS